MARYKSIAIVAAVLTFGYALGHITTIAMLSGEADVLLFLRNTVGLVMGSGILWASMSVWAGRIAGPRLWFSHWRLRQPGLQQQCFMDVRLFHHRPHPRASRRTFPQDPVAAFDCSAWPYRRTFCH